MWQKARELLLVENPVLRRVYGALSQTWFEFDGGGRDIVILSNRPAEWEDASVFRLRMAARREARMRKTDAKAREAGKEPEEAARLRLQEKRKEWDRILRQSRR